MKRILSVLLTLTLLLGVCPLTLPASSAGESRNLAKGIATGLTGYGFYNADLTDGVAASELSYDNQWFAFYYNDREGIPQDVINAPDGLGVILLDLGKQCQVEKVRVNTFLGNTSGVIAPKSIKAEISADGETYTEIGIKSCGTPAVGNITVAWVELAKSVTGRYVKITVELNRVFAFLNEVEVIGCEMPEEETPENYEADIAAGMGKENENDQFDLFLESKQDGEDVTVTLTVGDLRGEFQELHALEATLCYDAKRVECVSETTEENALTCIESSPEGWSQDDNLTHLDPQAGSIRIALAVIDGKPVTNEQPLVLTFRFRKIAEQEQVGFWIPHASVKGYNEYFNRSCSGKGAYTVTHTHAPGDWEVTKEPTVDEEGERCIRCTTCGEVLEQEVLPKLEPPYIPGDINGDGKVNSKDLTRLIKWLSGEDVEVVEDALDTNGDGKTNMKDYTRLLKYLSGEDIELH